MTTKHLHHRLNRLTRLISDSQNKLEKNMNGRLATGALLFILIVLGASKPEWKWVGLLFLATLAALVFLIVATKNLRRYNHQLSAWQNLIGRQLARRQGQAPQLHVYKPEFINGEQESLSGDLHLFGSHSLFSILDENLSDSGKNRLACWLLDESPSLEKVQQRQALISHLAKHSWLLTRLRFLASPEAPVAASQLQSQLSRPALGPNFKKYAILHAILFPVAWVGFFGSIFLSWPVSPWLPLVIYLVYMLIARSEVELTFSKAQEFSLELSRLIPIFSFIEKRLSVTAAAEVVSTISKEQPSTRLSKINSLVSFLSVQAHPIAFVVANLIFPWEYFFGYQVERWRRAFEPVFPKLLDELSELEALLSCTLFYTYQTQTFPELSDERRLEVVKTHHPLLARDQAVSNSFSFTQTTRLALITGSNMSGKSTFLRTIGVNQVLANMGCPVFAEKWVSYPAPVKTSLQVTDSLEQGYSTFYSEVRRISELLKSAEKGERFIYLIDEIFRGTNNRERLIGSKAVIEHLLRYPQIIGFVSTHDLELTQIGDTFSELGNWHFRDEVQDGQLHFSYRIHPGPCPTTNALKIMAREGLPVDPKATT